MRTRTGACGAPGGAGAGRGGAERGGGQGGQWRRLSWFTTKVEARPPGEGCDGVGTQHPVRHMDKTAKSRWLVGLVHFAPRKGAGDDPMRAWLAAGRLPAAAPEAGGRSPGKRYNSPHCSAPPHPAGLTSCRIAACLPTHAPSPAIHAPAPGLAAGCASATPPACRPRPCQAHEQEKGRRSRGSGS